MEFLIRTFLGVSWSLSSGSIRSSDEFEQLIALKSLDVLGVPIVDPHVQQVDNGGFKRRDDNLTGIWVILESLDLHGNLHAVKRVAGSDESPVLILNEEGLVVFVQFEENVLFFFIGRFGFFFEGLILLVFD